MQLSNRIQGEASTGNISTSDATGFKTVVGGFFGDILNLGTSGYEKYLEFRTANAVIDSKNPDTSKTPNASTPVFASIPPLMIKGVIAGLFLVVAVKLVRKGEN